MRNEIQRGLILLVAASMLVITPNPAATGQVMSAAAIQGPDTTASQINAAAPLGDIGTQIVGGRPASRYYDGLSALEYDSVNPPRDDHMTCTAVLLRNPATPGWSQWGATAAHCVTELPAMAARSGTAVFRDGLFGAPLWVPVKERQYQLRTGNLDRTLAAPLQIAQVVVVPEWQWIPGGPAVVDPTPAADVALFRLSTPVKVTGATVADTQPRPGTSVRIVGWGRTSNQSAATPTIANELRTKVVRPQACAGGEISIYDLCTDNPGGSGACNAESGGPVYTPVRNRWEVVGLVSRGETAECGASPDVHTGLARYKPWIDAVTQGRLPYDHPLTAAQGGDPGHPTIRFNTTAP